MKHCCKKPTFAAMSVQRKQSHIGLLGLSASILCAIHCVSMPFILSASALGTTQLISNPLIEITLILISVIFGYSVIRKGYLNHKKTSIMAIFIMSSIFLIIFGIIIHDHESPISAIGGIGIAISFLLNWKAIQK